MSVTEQNSPWAPKMQEPALRVSLSEFDQFSPITFEESSQVIFFNLYFVLLKDDKHLLILIGLFENM